MEGFLRRLACPAAAARRAGLPGHRTRQVTPARQVTNVTASGGPLSPADHVTSAGSPRLTRPAVIARPSAPQWVAPRRVRPGRGSYATGGRPLTQLSGRYVA